MSIKSELYMTKEDGSILVRTYSDRNYKIKQNETNSIYDDAIDDGVQIGNLYHSIKYTYDETETKIESEEEQ